MNQRILEEGLKTTEGRLKIKRIKHLKRVNGILTILHILGIGSSLHTDFICILSLFSGLFGLETIYPPVIVLCCLIFSLISGKKFTIDIPISVDYNNKEIVKLENEIYDEDKEELVK